MNYNISYTFRLIDQFSGGAMGLAAAMGRVSSAARMMGGALGAVAAGGAMITMFGNAVEAAQGWENSMSNVRRLANLTRGEMVSYGRDALDLSVKFGKPVSEVADTMARLAGLGFRGQKVLKELTDLSMLAASNWDGATPEQTARTLGKFADTWFSDMSTDKMIKRVKMLSDAINELGDNANFQEGQLLKYIDRSGPIMKSLGFTPEQTAAFGGAALATGVESGQMQGTRAEATVRALLSAGAKATPKQVWGLKQVGLTPESWATMVRANPQDAMLSMFERVQRFDKIGKQGVINSIIGSRQGAQFVHMAENLNEYKRQLALVDDTYADIFSKDDKFMGWLKKSGRYDALVADLEKYGKSLSRVGSLERNQKDRTDNLEFAVKRREAAWNKLLTTMGEPYLVPMANLNKSIADAMDAVTQKISANPALGQGIAMALGAAIAASIGTAIWAGMGATGGILSSLLVGGMMGALVLTVAVALIGAGAWIFMNWDAFVASVTKPLDIQINWPNAPEWLQWLPNLINGVSGARDRELRAQEKFASFGFDDDAYQSRWAMPSNADGMAKIISEAARRGAAGDPFAQFPSGPSMPNLTAWDRITGAGYSNESLLADKAWAGRDNLASSNLASSIPQSVAVTIEPVNFNPATVNVNVTGQVNGPLQGTGSGTLQAEPSRGTSTSAVGGNPMGPR